jgi:uncharacterized protein (DUF302 family)
MQVNYKTEISGTVETAVTKITDALLKEGFGVLTRIDLHTKIKDKLNKMIPPTVILGACNPALAYEAFNSNPDVASLLPCNAVVREIVPGLISIELAKPSALMEILGDKKLIQLAGDADRILEKVIKDLH